MSKQLILELLISMILICMPTSGLYTMLIRAAPVTIVVPDDYPTIQEAVNSAGDGDTIFVKAGAYYEHVVVNKTVSLVGEDVGTTIIDGGDTGHVVYVVRRGVNITGFTVRNSGNVHWPGLDAGICLDGTTGCVISENRVVDNGFAGISLLNSQYNKIAGNNVSDTGWGGIHLMNSSRNTVFDNILDGNGQQQQWGGGINGHAGSHYNNIMHNTITDCVYGMFYHDARYNNICKNNISAISAIGIWLQDQVNYNVVAENTLINCTVGIRLQGPNYGNVVSGNFLANGQSGIRVESVSFAEICNNTIIHNYGAEWDAGIRLDSAGYSRIHSNLIADNWRGILLYTSSPHVSIYNNTITDNDFAVRVANGGSSYLNVSDNVIMHNRGYGIGLTGFGGASNYATISRNLIANNSDGIALGQYSNYNTIILNNISQNGYGFYIEYSTQNTIWGNNIVDNDQQVHVSASSNNWDGGYNTGGNYWSNYADVDIYRGQDQNLPGSDGVGDTPHIIDPNNRDNYSLIEPWSWTPNDVAVEVVTLSRNVVGQGYNMHANVTVTNQGLYTEAFCITLYVNTTAIETREVLLSSGNSTILTFMWNTSGFVHGDYVPWVYAEPVPDEVYMADNTYAASAVTVTFPGDVDGDRDVDILDMVSIAGKYGKYIPAVWPLPPQDVDGDCDVDIFDIVIAAGNYGES
jgi:parallel beta-helix repeat protein